MSHLRFVVMHPVKRNLPMRSCCVVAFFLSMILLSSWCYALNQLSDYAATPPFVSVVEKPSVMVILDNSGSMHEFAYQEREAGYKSSSTATAVRSNAGYVPSTTYYGYFLSKKRYTYDGTNKYFKEAEAGEWYGNFLNWLFMKRMDVAKKVMTGGMVSTAGDGSTVLAGERPDGASSKRGEYKVYDDTNTVSDLDGVSGKYMSPFHQSWVMSISSSFNSSPAPQVPAVTFYAISSVTNEGNGWSNGEVWQRTDSTTLKVGTVGTFYLRVKVDPNPTGLIQKNGDKIRFGLTVYRYEEGGKVLQYVGSPISDIATTINGIYPSTWTPLAETLHTVMNYFGQQSRYYNSEEYTISNTWDPYYFNDRGAFVPCSKGFVILITDGESTKDKNIPSSLKDYAGTPTGSYDSDGTDYLRDVALYAHTNDLRTGSKDLPGIQSLNIFTIFAFGQGAQLLKEAAINGGYVDVNKDGRPNTEAEEQAAPYNRKEWDFDGDSNPDNYAAAPSGQELEDALVRAIESILSRISSGTAASVISNTRSGEGAVYQAVFYPQFEDKNLNKVQWAGQVHALFIDKHGNMREDTNQNARLDVCNETDTLKCPDKSDLIVMYKVLADGTTDIYKYKDANGNGYLDGNEYTNTSLPGYVVGMVGNAYVEKTPISGIKYVWNTSKWLNEISDTNIVNQRTYGVNTKHRYIFTMVDANKDGIPDATLDFQTSTDPSAADLVNTAKIFPYLHTHTPFTAPRDNSNNLIPSGNLSAFRSRQTKRVIDYIRGKDQGTDTVGSPASTIAPFRSRQVNYDDDLAGTLETWRLGDIVHSTPTVVGKPAEDFDLIYRDKSYSAFYAKYKDRRTVVYAGANDGMIHAFNGGFYDKENKSFLKELNGEAEHDLGSELWAYVPFNLLPHLYWLTSPNYSHVYYVDAKPRVFDARIFPDDATHPNGWGTVLVCGMRLGGGAINADVNKNDTLDANDPTMRSAYVVMDVTDPEVPPTVLAELSFDELGFTTSYPTILLATQKNASGVITGQNWYLVFGSGPIDDTDGAGPAALASVTSSKSAKIFMVDLKGLTASVPTVTKLAASGQDYFVALDTKSFVSDLVAVDFNLDYSADVLYFGTVKGNLTEGWGGKLRRIVVDDKMATHTPAASPLNPSSWITDSTLIDLTTVHNGQPIVAAPSVAKDDKNRFWVYFGTGRFFNREDATGARSSDQQSFYGIKEPADTTNPKNPKFTWAAVPYSPSSLLDVSNSAVSVGGDTVSGVSGVSNFNELLSAVNNGWYKDFPDTGERNLGQATVFGELVAFTTYTPSADYCSFEGTSKFWALYYKTGTGYKDPAFKQGENETVVSENVDLGIGLSVTPNLHVDAEGNVTALVQQSTGAIQSISMDSPGAVGNGFMSWKEE